MLPSSLPRHPCEEAKLGTNSLIVIVSSSMIWLQHKASCYCGHGYSNRLIFPAGVHYWLAYTLESPGWRTPCQGMPHRGPSYDSSERSPPVYIPKGKGFMGLSPLALWVVVRRVNSS